MVHALPACHFSLPPSLPLMSVRVTILTRATVRFLFFEGALHSLKQHPLVELLGEMTGGGLTSLQTAIPS